MFSPKLSFLFSANRFVKKIFLFITLLLTVNLNAFEWNCDSLYSVADGGEIRRLSGFSAGSNTYDNINMGILASGKDTIALGPDGSANGPLTMFVWDFTLTSAASRMEAFRSGASSASYYGEFRPPVSPRHNTYPGGEVNKLTGEIYFSSGSGSNQPINNFDILIWNHGKNRDDTGGALGGGNPPVGNMYFWKNTTPIQPADPSKLIDSLPSDMAIDAEGNVFAIARQSNSDSSWVVVKINIDKNNPSGWTYSVMGNTLKSSSGSNFDFGYSTIYGLAFYKGKLYVSRTNHLWEINPMSGVTRPLIDPGHSSFDLASCDVAVSLTGKIYNDADGDGIINGDEQGISGVTVEIYDKTGAYKSTARTDSTGTYNFLLDETGSDTFFTVRVKQPKINGINAAQTWASGGTFSYIGSIGAGTNTVTNYCTDFINNTPTASSSNRTCYGARVDGKESSLSSLNEANYYSKVDMRTSNSVPHVNFAFSTASDRSDSNQPEVLHNIAIKHNNALRAYLGDDVTLDINSIRSVNASSDSNDDGLFVLINNRYMPIQQRGFVRGESYNLKADINGSLKANAKLNLWLGNSFTSSSPVWGIANLSNTTGDNIYFTNSMPNTAGTLDLRARFGTSLGVNAVNNISTNSNDPWVMDGEVEDYQIFLVNRQVRLSLKTMGTIGNSGNFTFTLDNINTASPSSNKAVISTNSPDTITDEPLGVTHEIINSNQAVSVTVDKPQSLGISQSQTNCTDINNNNANVPLTFERYEANGVWYDNITLSSSYIKSNSDIVCLFSYGIAPVISVTANITNRGHSSDAFNLEIFDISADKSLASKNITTAMNNTTISAVLEAGNTNNISITMLQGSNSDLARYAIEKQCIKNGIQTPWEDVTQGWFDINATFADNITCIINIEAEEISIINSIIEVIPHINDAGNTSLVLITLKDGANVTIPSGGDIVELFMSANVSGMVLTNSTHSIISHDTTHNITALDNGDGTYTANITSNVSGYANLTFAVNRVLSNNRAEAVFRHLKPDINNINTNITIAIPSVDVGTNATAVVNVADMYNNGVTNATVALFVVNNQTLGAPVLYNSNVINHNNGSYSINFTSAYQGNVTVGFSVDGINANPLLAYKNATAVFTADDYNVSSPYSNITITPNSRVVEQAALVTVYLSDNQGLNGISGKDVRLVFTDNRGVNATIYPDNTTYRMNDNMSVLGNGYYTAWINSTIADTYTLSFKVGENGVRSIHTANVTYHTGPVVIDNSTLSYIRATAQTVVTNNSTIKVYLADKYGNTIKDAIVGVRVIANDTGNFIPIGSNNSITFTENLSDPKGGYYTVFYTTNIQSNVTFGFSANSIAADDSNNNTTRFTNSGPNINNDNTTFNVNPHNVLIGNNVTLTLYLSDSTGLNGVAGQDVEFTVSKTQYENGTLNIGNDGSVVISSITDHNNGTYTALASTNISQNVTFHFSVDGISPNPAKSDWAKFNPLNVDLSSMNTTITANPSSLINANSTITVKLVDSNNNPVNNETVTVKVLAGNGGNQGIFYNGTSSQTNIGREDGSGNGIYRFYFTTPIAENVTFGFELLSGAENRSKNATTEFTTKGPDINNANTTFNVNPHNVLAGNNVTITLYLTDDTGINGESGQSVAFFVESRSYENGTSNIGNDGSVIISSITDHNNGTYTALASTNISQNVTFHFSVAGSSPSPAKSDWAKFNPLNVNLSSMNTTITATPSTAINTNSTITVKLVDSNNNPVNNETVTVKVLTGNGGNQGIFYNGTSYQTSIGREDGSGNGIYRFYFTTPIAENVTFGFELSNGAENRSKNATTEFTITGIGVNNPNTLFSAYPHELLIGETTSLNLYLSDSTGVNGVPGQNVEFYIVKIEYENGTVINDNNSVYITNFTDHNNGTYTALASTNISQNVTFNFRANGQTNTSKSDWAKFKIRGADLNSLNTTITATPSTTVDTNSTIIVKLVDSNNNPVNNETVTVKVLTGNSGSQGIFYNGTSYQTSIGREDGSGNGIYRFYFTTPIAETITFGFELLSGDENRSKNASTIFTSADASNTTSSLSFTPNYPSVSVESFFNATAIIKDGNGNAKSNTDVTFLVTGGVLNSASNTVVCTTNAQGVCSVIWTSNISGEFTLSAVVNAAGHITNSPANKTFSAGQPNASTSIFMLEQGPKVAGGSFNMNTTLKDRYGNAIHSQNVYYVVTPAVTGAGFRGSELDNDTQTTGPEALSKTVFSSIKAGNYTVRAYYGDDADNRVEVTGSGQIMQFIPSSANASYSNITILNQGPVTSQGGYYTVTIYAIDNVGGNPVPNAKINVNVTGGTLFDGLNVKSTICTTNSLGICEYSWSSPNDKGIFTITAMLDGVNIAGSPTQREFTSLSANATLSYMTVTPNGPITADGSQYYEAVITLRDNGSMPTGGSVNVAVTGGLLNAAASSGSYSVDPVTGKATLYWTSDKSGEFNITARIGGIVITNGTQSKVFEAGESNASNSIFTISPSDETRIADNVSHYTLSVHINDDFNNNKPGAIVTFRVQEGYLNNGTVSPNSIICTTNANGNCSVTWVSDKVGEFTANATVEGYKIGEDKRGIFTQGAASNITSSLTVDPTTPKTSDNVSYFKVTANIKDALNHNVKGESVTFIVSGGWLGNATHNGSTQFICVTNEEGVCELFWRSAVSGIFKVTASIVTGKIGDEDRSFIAPNAAAANSTLEVTPNGPISVGGGANFYSVKVTAKGVTGTPAFGDTIRLVVEGGELNASYANNEYQCAADINGECNLIWTSNRSGNFSINAYIGSTAFGGNGDLVKASPQYRVFNPLSASSYNSTLVITPNDNTVIANSGNYYTLNIAARDIYNNGVPNQAMSINIGYGELNNGTGFTVGNSSCLTNANGDCQVLWRSDKAGNFSVTARIQGQLNPIYSSDEDKSRRFSYANLDRANSHIIVTSYNASQPDYISVCTTNDIPSCGSYYNVTVYAKDTANNNLAGESVEFVLFRGGQISRDAYWNDIITSTPPEGKASCVLGVDGKCSANVILKAKYAGEYLIYASVNSEPISPDTGYAVHFSAGAADADKSYIEFNPSIDSSIAADNVSYYTAAVVLSDAVGNNISNAVVTLNVTSNSNIDNGTLKGSSVTCATNTQGRCLVNWRSSEAFVIHNITAAVQSIVLNGNRTFKNNDAISYSVSNITVSSHNVTVDENVTVTVTVNDAFGNPIKMPDHTVIIYTSLGNSSFIGGSGQQSAALTNIDGTYTAVLKSTNIGNTTLTFRIDNIEAAASEWVVFNSGPPDINPSNNNTYIKAVSPTEVGNNSLVTVYVGDKYGNPINNQTIIIYILDDNTNTANFNGAQSVTVPLGVKGEYTANLTAFDKGNVSVSFSLGAIDGNDYGKNATVEFRSGIANASTSIITVSHDIDNSVNASADGVDYYTVRVTAKDAFGVTVSNANVTFVITKGSISNTSAAPLTVQTTISCITDGNGMCAVYWTSLDWGNADVSASIESLPVSSSPVTREFRRIVFDDNLTITDFAPSSKKARVGDLVRYSVVLENNINQVTTFDLNNLIPQGFTFVEGSISINNGTSVNSTYISNREFNGVNIVIPEYGELTVIYILRVGANVKKGVHKVYSEAFKGTLSISNRAVTDIEITGDPMIDESLIFGTVYIDKNGNGMQDEGESGIPGVRIATVEGYIITTDQFGRYHLLNILGGEWGVGRNFIMKVDPSSLPKDSTFTTANPLLRRLTPGIPVRFDFGVKLPKNMEHLSPPPSNDATLEGGVQ